MTWIWCSDLVPFYQKRKFRVMLVCKQIPNPNPNLIHKSKSKPKSKSPIPNQNIVEILSYSPNRAQMLATVQITTRFMSRIKSRPNPKLRKPNPKPNPNLKDLAPNPKSLRDLLHPYIHQ